MENRAGPEPEVSTDLAGEDKTYRNVSQIRIEITEDRVRLILGDYEKGVAKRGGWVAPFGIILAILGMFATAKFQDAFSLSADTWQAFFMFVLLFCLGRLAWVACGAWRAPHVATIDDVIKNMKG